MNAEILLLIITMRRFPAIPNLSSAGLAGHEINSLEFSMFKIISLAMHFSPFRQGPIDPVVVEMLQREFAPKSQRRAEVLELETKTETLATRKAA